MGEHKYNPNVLKFKNQVKPGQVQIDVSQAVKTICQCGNEFFDKCCRMGTISALSPGNPIGKDIPVEYPVYLCRQCGLEFGKVADIVKQ